MPSNVTLETCSAIQIFITNQTLNKFTLKKKRKRAVITNETNICVVSRELSRVSIVAILFYKRHCYHDVTFASEKHLSSIAQHHRAILVSSLSSYLRNNHLSETRWQRSRSLIDEIVCEELSHGLDTFSSRRSSSHFSLFLFEFRCATAAAVAHAVRAGVRNDRVSCTSRVRSSDAFTCTRLVSPLPILMVSLSSGLVHFTSPHLVLPLLSSPLSSSLLCSTLRYSTSPRLVPSCRVSSRLASPHFSSSETLFRRPSPYISRQ